MGCRSGSEERACGTAGVEGETAAKFLCLWNNALRQYFSNSLAGQYIRYWVLNKMFCHSLSDNCSTYIILRVILLCTDPDSGLQIIHSK